MKVKVKLLKDWRDHKAGEVVELDPAVAKTLVETGYAEDAEPAGAGDVAAQLAKAKADLSEGIKGAVADAVKDACKGLTLKDNKVVFTGGTPRDDEDPMGGFRDDAEFYLAVRDASAKGGRVDERLGKIAEIHKRKMIARFPQIQSDSQAMSKVAAVGTGAEGGFLVPEETSTRMFARMSARLGIIEKCDRIVLSGFSVRMPGLSDASRAAAATRYGGIVVYNVAEAASITASSLKFREIRLEVRKKAALATVTDEMMSAVANFGTRLTDMMADAIGDEVVEDIMFGSGAGVCLGAFASAACVSVAKETDQEADTIVARNLTNMEAALAEGCEGAEFYHNPECLTQLAFLAIVIGAGGVPVLLPAGGISQQPYSQIFGRRATKTDHCEKLGDAGDIVLGDFSKYLLATRGGVQTAMSVHLYFDYDLTAFRATFEVDGKPSWDTTMTPRKGATATRVAPFVKLAAR